MHTSDRHFSALDFSLGGYAPSHGDLECACGSAWTIAPWTDVHAALCLRWGWGRPAGAAMADARTLVCRYCSRRFRSRPYIDIRFSERRYGGSSAGVLLWYACVVSEAEGKQRDGV